MDARIFTRSGRIAVLLAAMVAVPVIPSAWAGGVRGGSVFHAGAGLHGGGGVRGLVGSRAGGFRGLPPVSGVIHERPGTTPYLSAYGHTNTAARIRGLGFAAARGGRPYGAAYGHVGTAFRPGVERGAGLIGRGGLRRFGGLGRLRFAEARRRFGYVGGYGGYGVGGIGLYGAPGLYGGGGVYGDQGTYGGGETYATQGIYGTEPGSSYLSETPLALRFAEAPLAPSPYAPYSPADTYADTGPDAVGSGPRIVTVSPLRSSGCDCGPRARTEPVVYRYGIGTAD